MALFLPCITHGQDHVIANATTSVLPELHGDKPFLDRDLQTALKQFNGQNALDMRDRSVGIVERALPSNMRSRGDGGLVAEGVVLRTEAFITPDKNGIVTVLTVLPTVILREPSGFPPPAPSSTSASRRRLPANALPPPPIPPRPAGSTLRFAMAGGIVYFDDNNGATVRQAGVRYPAPGESLIFFSDTISGDHIDPPSSVLRLTGACALQDNACLSIDGNPAHSDALTAGIPGGLAAAQAYNMAGAPIADNTQEGIRGLASVLETRYNLGQGSLRAVPDPEIDMPPFTPANADTAVLRAHILKSDASLTVGALGLVMTATAGIEKVYAGALPGGKTLDIVQRGGLLWKSNTTLLSAFASTQQPLVDGATYYLAVGRTSDNRWELQSAWRIVDDQVFAMDRPRSLPFSGDTTFYWKSTDAFLKAHGLH